MRSKTLLRVCLLTVVFFALAACATGEEPAEETKALPIGSPTAVATPLRTTAFDGTKYESVNVFTITEGANEGRSLLIASYPVTEQDAINARLEALTQEFIDEFRTIAADTEQSYQQYKNESGKEAATFVTHYRQHFDVAVANENLIFFDVVRSVYTGGTGNAYVIGYIFDRRSGAELSLPDLFVDEEYLGRLSALSRKALAERTQSRLAEQEFDSEDALKKALEASLEWIEEGTEPTAENFDNILFRENGTVLVRFDKYQVAPGVDGVVEIALPVAELAELIKPAIRDLLGLAAPAPQTERAASSQQSEASSQERAPAGDNVNCYEVPCVALTFDDGPSVFTERLLDVLGEHDVKATFFILGSRARIQSETVYRAFQEGHEIGNHTWDHPLLTDLGAEQIREQIQWTDDIITQIIGEAPEHIRPPYGAYDDHVLAVAAMPFIFWSVDPLDWRDRDAEIVAGRIIDSPAGAIILAHDIHETTVDAIPAVIAVLKDRGIHFVTVTELFAPQELLPGYVYSQQPESPN